MKVATVFSGIGAIEHALKRMNLEHEIVFACDNCDQVKKSYMANYDLDEEHFHDDVTNLDGKQYTGDVDLFVGGSPCQSFSKLGKRKGFDDTRGTLFFDYARLIKEIKPKFFIYENIRELLSNDNGRTWEIIKSTFDKLGYNYHHEILNAKNYGVPQSRNRVFVVGFRRDIELTVPFEFPHPVALKKTMPDYLLSDVSPKYFFSEKGINCITREERKHKQHVDISGKIQMCQRKQQQTNWNGSFVFVEESNIRINSEHELKLLKKAGKAEKHITQPWGNVSYSPKGETSNQVNMSLSLDRENTYAIIDGYIRKLTPRECLRLMGFADDFKIVCSDITMYQQSGNSIVVDVLIAIMQQIIKSYPELNGRELIGELENWRIGKL